MATKSVTVFKSKVLSDSITRPANTTAYAAGDVVSDATDDAHYTFQVGGDGGKPLHGSIDYARMMVLANQGTLPDLELWLFHTDIAAVEDNAAFAPTDAEIQTFIGKINFGVDDWSIGLSGSGADGNIVQPVTNVGIIVPSTNGAIYGQLVARNAYTPISGEQFFAELVITLDG